MSGVRPVLAWSLAGATVAFAGLQTAVLIASGVPLVSAAALDQAYPIVPIALIVGAVVGALIVQRHPAHRIGWLLCVGQVGSAFGLAVQSVAFGVLGGGLAWGSGTGHLAAWLSRFFSGNYALMLLGCLLLLVPDGRLLSRRWGSVLVVLAGGYLASVGALLVTPPADVGPDGFTSASPAVSGLVIGGSIAIIVGLVGAAAALVIRLRRARSVQRQQLRWITAAAALLAGALLLLGLASLLPGGSAVLDRALVVLLYLCYLAVPVAIGVAVLRYRLYQIDVIIGSAVRVAVVGTFVTAGYVALVVALGPLVGYLFGASAQPWLTVVAYVLVALAFQPLRRFVDRLADRAVYGVRAAPYESLLEFGSRLADTPDRTALLDVVAESCARAVGAVGAEVEVALGGPGGASARAEYRAAGAAAVDPLSAVTVEIRDGSAAIGQITVHLQPRQSLRRADRALLHDLADRAGPAFHNVALSAELESRAALLAEQATELAESRRRLLAAADGERELTAASIRDRVAGPLSSMPSALASLRVAVGAHPAVVASQLATLRELTESALVALREITGGVHPPLLTRRGLAAALDGLAARAERHPVLDLPADLAGRRFGAAIEGTGYFCCRWAIEAMTGGSPARIAVSLPAHRLRLTLVGSPVEELAALPRWQQLLDRVHAVGGTIEGFGRSDMGVLTVVVDLPTADDVDSADGQPSVPAGASGIAVGAGPDSADHSAANRSGPNRDFSR